MSTFGRQAFGKVAHSLAVLGPVARQAARGFGRVGHWLAARMPKGLYARAQIIIITPLILLQLVIAYAFLERHWQLVTQRLSNALTQDIAALIDIYESYPQDRDNATLVRIAAQRLSLDVDILPPGPLPVAGPKPFFDILDAALSSEISTQIKRPFWLDTVGRSSFIEIRVLLPDATFRVIARRSQAYASNAHIFLVWMAGSSAVLILIAMLFLRNQIKPILQLAEAAEGFGKGREVDFRPRGAREVRAAAIAFIEMRRRIERAIEQRTAMLNGVSHDLRTVLTRFKLSLAFFEATPEVEDLKRDVDEMSHMLEAYLAFARGDAGESAVETDIQGLLDELRSDAERAGHSAVLSFAGNPLAIVRPAAFKRLLDNLLSNAARFGDRIAIAGVRDGKWLTVTVDDDGPGVPAEMREEVFKPFLRLDEARNQDSGGSGLGLAIARDIARNHGGEITLQDSPLGGLRATVRVPA